jgi:hypothetical protein
VRGDWKDGEEKEDEGDKGEGSFFDFFISLISPLPKFSKPKDMCCNMPECLGLMAIYCEEIYCRI